MAGHLDREVKNWDNESSEESSTYGDDELYNQLICDYEQSQLETTQSVALSACSEGTSIQFNTTVSGKRKADEPLAAEQQPPLKRQSLQTLLNSFKDRCRVVHSDEPVVNSPPFLMANLFTILPYGAQYEFARLVNNEKIKWFDFDMDTHSLFKTRYTTNVAAAPRIAGLVGVKATPRKAFLASPEDGPSHLLFEKKSQNTWDELDREEQALSMDPYGAMGYNKDGSPSEWCGGHVEFHGTLLVNPLTSDLKLRLEKPTLGPSNQLTRRFGSRHFFRIKVSKAVLQTALLTKIFRYLLRPFVICGGVYRAFYSKDDKIFLLKTNETWNGNRIEGPRVGTNDMTFLEFIHWHNPMDLNVNQAMAKWASRFSLGLSTSVPGYLLPKDSIRYRDDIVNPLTKANMTDGAGSLNRCLVQQLRYRYDWKEIPSAFQVRVNGSKGLLVEDIDDQSNCPLIFLTPSQIKIKYPGSDADPAHFAIDMLRASHLKTPCRLSAETIVNLGENGVPKESFVILLEAILRDNITPLLNWDSQQALLELWRLVQRYGGVLSSRRAREQPAIARLKGWSERDLDENEIEDEDGFGQLNALEEKLSTRQASDPLSGSPSSISEAVMYLLDSGFEPNTCPALREKLKNVVEGHVRREIESFRFEVPMSASSFITPDCRGLLAEGEVFFKSSSLNLLLEDGSYTDILVGDVLLARHPCKLPTDIRKWKAVDRPELHPLPVDVIVLPTRGPRRAADWLAGGDYDGDKAIVIWQPELIVPFQNADPKYADPPEDMNKFFKKEVEYVSDFINRVSEKTTGEIIRDFQYHLLGSLRNTTAVGMYSNFHDYAIYTLGYTHPTTRRLAYMFCMTLDGSKTGLSVNEDVLEQDRSQFNRSQPAWKGTQLAEEDGENGSDQAANTPPARPSHLPRFIMDDLCEEARRQGELWGEKITNKFNFFCDQGVMDRDLAAPYNEILGKSREPHGGRWYLADLEIIQKHVEDIYEEYIQVQKCGRASGHKDLTAGSRTEGRREKMRALSLKFAHNPNPDNMHMSAEDVKCVKTSYAFVYDCERRREETVKWSGFPWEVAFRDLCDIKARAIGNHKAVFTPFYEHMVIKVPKKKI